MKLASFKISLQPNSGDINNNQLKVRNLRIFKKELKCKKYWILSHVLPFLSPLQVDNDIEERDHEGTRGTWNQLALALRWPSHLSRHLISIKLNCDRLSHNLMLAPQACWDGPYLSRHQDQRHVAEVAAPCQTKEELWSLRLNSTQGRIIGPRKNLRPASNPKILEKSREDSQAHQTPCPNSSSHCSFPSSQKHTRLCNQCTLRRGRLKTHINSEQGWDGLHTHTWLVSCWSVWPSLHKQLCGGLVVISLFQTSSLFVLI